MFNRNLWDDILDYIQGRDISDLFEDDLSSERFHEKIQDVMPDAREIYREQYQIIDNIFQLWWQGKKITDNDKKEYYKCKERIFTYKAFFEVNRSTVSKRLFYKGIMAGIVAAGSELKYFNSIHYEEMNKVFDKWWRGEKITRDDKLNYYFNKSLIFGSNEISGFNKRIDKKSKAAKSYLDQL